MGSQEFGQLVEAARLRKGWTRSKLAVATGILEDGSVLDATQIRRVVDGTRKLDQDMVARIIRALGLSESEAEEAWHASGVWPPDLDLEGYRRYRQEAAVVGASSVQGEPKSGPSWRRAGERRRADRRQWDRRHIRLVPTLVPALEPAQKPVAA